MHRRPKLIATYVASSLVIMGLIAFMTWTSYRDVIQLSEATTRNYAGIIEARLDATFRRAEAHVLELVRDIPHAALSRQAERGHASSINAGLDARRLNFPELVGLRIFDAQGNLLYTSESATTARVNAADRDYFRVWRETDRRTTFFSEAVVSRITQRPAMFIAQPIRDAKGVLLGVVSASVELSYFQKLFQTLELGQDGVVAVYRTDDFSLVVRWPAPTSNQRIVLPPGTPNRVAIEQGSRFTTQEFRAAVDGVTRIYSMRVLESYPFYVTVGISKTSAVENWMWRSLVIGALSIVLVVLILLTSHRMWRGDERLRDANEKLEMRVAERTGELERAKLAAEEANKAKSQFLSNMSHELRTPMNSVLGFAELIEVHARDAETPSTAGEIRKAGEHLLELLNEVLDLSRIESGQLKLNVDDVHLGEILDERLHLIEPQAQARHIRLAIGEDMPPDLFVRADRFRLKQALLNYLSNAIKYNREHGEVLVVVKIARGGRVRITVMDNGAGISPERLSRLFQPFSRLPEHANTIDGTGIGLALTKRLIDAIGGRVGAKSEVGKGSKFWLELNRATPPDSAGFADGAAAA